MFCVHIVTEKREIWKADRGYRLCNSAEARNDMHSVFRLTEMFSGEAASRGNTVRAMGFQEAPEGAS